MCSLLSFLPLSLRADSTLVFNEVMYHSSTEPDGLEWIELYNQMAVDLDISHWALTGAVEFSIPEGTVVRGGGFLVVAKSPQTLKAATGFAGALGPFTGRLDDGGERLELRNNNFRLMDSVRYDDEGDWPVGPDGSGVSLAKIDPDFGSAPPENWAMSLKVGGTPGANNFPQGRGPAQLPPPLALNELSVSPEGEPWVELVNRGVSPLPIEGVVLETS